MWNVRFVAVLAVLAGPVGGTLAAVSDYPNKPLRYVSASAPGGASDIIARAVGAALSDVLGVQVVIDNRAGAGNTIGAEVAAHAPPDGYTIFGCNIASLAVSLALYKKLAYDPERDFALLGMVASNPNVLTVHPSLPATTVSQFISLAKAHPGKLNYGSAGVGSSPQLSMELLRLKAHINVVHIAYKGVAPALVDLMGGRIDAVFSTVPSVLPFLRRGKVRALGVTSLKRDPDLPDVPSIAEAALPGFEVVSWQGLCTQSAAPQAAVVRLRSALATVLEQPETRRRISDAGFQPHVMPADEFATFVAAERVKWAQVIRAIGIEPQ